MQVNHYSLAFRKARESRNLTQVQLAEIVGCSKVTIQRLEGGTEWTHADIPVRVAKALGMKLSTIIKFAEGCSSVTVSDTTSCASSFNREQPMR